MTLLPAMNWPSPGTLISATMAPASMVGHASRAASSRTVDPPMLRRQAPCVVEPGRLRGHHETLLAPLPAAESSGEMYWASPK